MSRPAGSTPVGLLRRLAESQDAALARLPERAIALPPATAPAIRTGRLRARLAFASVALAVAAAGAVVASLGWLVWPERPLAFQLARTGQLGAPGQTLVADARAELPLQFTDGSLITFRAGAAGRVDRTSERGADVVLERGALEAHVLHAERTLWRVHAGPYTVRVTGTRFVTSWAAGRFELQLLEGSVVVEGALMSAALPVRAPHQLTIEAGVVRTQPVGPVAPDASDAPNAPTSVPRGAVSVPATAAWAEPPVSDPQLPSGRAATQASAVGGPEWTGLAARGAYADALHAAERHGWAALVDQLDARELLMLGDVARYAGRERRARQAFEALVARFPGDVLAPDAVFSLGRLAYEGGEPRRAARWFQRYVARWPDGPLGDQAAGRLVECAVRLGDDAGARRAAEAYLSRAPAGPHADLARDVLNPVDATTDGDARDLTR